MSKDQPSLNLPFSRSLILYACLTGICLVLHNRMVDSAAGDARRFVHEQVMTNTAPAPLQYRLMTFSLAEGIQRFGKSLGFEDPFASSYLIVRGLFTLLAMILLHRFLRVYLPPPLVLLGVVIAFAWMPLTYINYYMQETDPANMVFFLLGYDFIRRRKDLSLAVLIPVAMLNRETPVLLPLVWLLYRWDEEKLLPMLAKFAGFCVAAFGTYFALRFMLGHHAAYAEFNDLALNFRSLNSYLYFLLLFGPLIPPALYRIREKPKFLRRLALFLPFFLVFHFVIPIFQETRLFLPIFPILLVLALTSWLAPGPGVFQMENRPAVSPLARWAKALAFGSFVLFVAGMVAYLGYLEKAHVGELRGKKKAEGYIDRGREAARMKDYVTAAREWEWGLLFDEDNFELHYDLAAIYAEYLWNSELARKHLAECRKIYPNDVRLPELERRINELLQQRERALGN